MPPQQNYLQAQVIALTADLAASLGTLLGNLDWTTKASSEASLAWLIETYEGELDGTALGIYEALKSAAAALIASFPSGG